MAKWDVLYYSAYLKYTGNEKSMHLDRQILKKGRRGLEADVSGNMKMSVNKILSEEVDWISATFCILQRKTLAKTVMNL
jgi:hypothetical protein